ncbi:hypothetical protein BX281_0228 [Streptomyces sp. Ag82_O1-15]|nr:hypothetical protein BX281_0228 [Streptomyces sp. Ag82_O1-15]
MRGTHRERSFAIEPSRSRSGHRNRLTSPSKDTRGLSQRTLAAAAEHLSADHYDDRFAYSVELILTGRSGST